MPSFRTLSRSTLKFQPLQSTDGVASEVTANTQSNCEMRRAEVSPDQNYIGSCMAVTGDITGHQTKQQSASKSRLEYPDHVLEGPLMKMSQKYPNLLDEILSQREQVHELQNQLHHISAKHQHLKGAYDELKGAYDELRQSHNEQSHKSKTIVRNYKDLDRKYMDVARSLQVTGDDRSTISKQLVLVTSSIENLVIKMRGKGSSNLNRVAAIQHFRESGYLQVFPIPEHDLESFHLNLFMESAIMANLIDRLFLRPLQCTFDQGDQFEAICEWMEGRGSSATASWRKELCILIAQDSEEMARRREKEVQEATVELKNLVSSVYGNVDTSMSDKIKELCNNAFDLAFAMFGMESRIYPVPIGLSIPFNDDVMTLTVRSDPRGLVSLLVFPRFQDSNNKLYFKAKVWCI